MTRKNIVETLPNKKLTDFFIKKSNTGGARAETGSSVADRDLSATITSSSATSSKMSKTKNNEGPAQSKTGSGSQRTSKVAPAVSTPTDKKPTKNTLTQSTRGLSPPSAMPSISPTFKVALPPRSSKKRKEQPTSHIRSDDSDNNDEQALPTIRVTASRVSPQPSFSQVLSTAPLTPRDNLEPVVKAASKLKSSQKTLSRNGPSPPKRARFETPKKQAQTQGSEADDERDDKAVMDVDVIALTQTQMDLDGVTPSTESGEPKETVPSSQENEIMLDFDVDLAAEADPVRSRATTPPPNDIPNDGLSPTKVRTLAIIADIKANAEALAAKEALEKSKRDALHLGSDDSDLSSVPDINDDESDDSLELNIDSIAKKGKRKEEVEPPAPPARRSDRQIFRGTSPSPTTSKSSTTRRAPPPKKGKAKADPLDLLLKDAKRDADRKVEAEKKRKHLPTITTSDDLGTVTGMSEPRTPERSGSYEDSDSEEEEEEDDNGAVMADEMRDALLGKEGSDAVGKILKKDREERGEKRGLGFVFWGSGGNRSGEVDVDDVPSFPLLQEMGPFVTLLREAVNRKDYTVSSLLLDSGALSQLPISGSLTGWLISTALSITHPALSTSAYNAFLTAYRYLSGSNPTPMNITAETVIPPLLKMGAKVEVCELLEVKVEEGMTGVDPSVRNDMVARYAGMMEALGRASALAPSSIPLITSTLLLLALDSSPSPVSTSAKDTARQSLTTALEAILSSSSITSPTIEHAICSAVCDYATVLGQIRQGEAMRIVAFLVGGSNQAARIRRWVAWSLLGGDLSTINPITPNTWNDHPPISFLPSLFERSSPLPSPKAQRFVVDKETDYEALAKRVDVMAVLLTDVEGLVRKDEGEKMGKKEKGVESVLKSVCGMLERLMGRIVDTRAAHLDRTFAKDTINRLHKRLVYSREVVQKRMRAERIKASKLDNWFKKQPKVEGGPKA